MFEFFSGVELVKVENEADSFGTMIPLNFDAELFLGAINMNSIIICQNIHWRLIHKKSSVNLFRYRTLSRSQFLTFQSRLDRS